jgi:hypothetical protein
MPAADGGVRHDYLLQFFAYDHGAGPPLVEVNQKFAELAQALMTLPSNAERTAALRKLIEARDCAGRAHNMK